MVGPPIEVGEAPSSIAITPDGSRVYVTNWASNDVTVIDLGTSAVVKSIPARDGPFGIVITPDGQRAYVSHIGSRDVRWSISPLTRWLALPSQWAPDHRALPSHLTARVSMSLFLFSGGVSVIDATTDTILGAPISVGRFPSEVAITPDGRRAYVTNIDSNTVSVIDVASNTVMPQYL